MSGNDWIELFVPGRLCLMGEHSDWAGTFRAVNSNIEKGHALVCGTNEGLFARVKAHPSKLVVSSTLNNGEISRFECDMREDVLLDIASKGQFWSYAAGVTYELLVHYNVKGLELENYKTTLPIKKGLSSSAAFCVLVSRAFNRLYNLNLTIRGEMDLAYRGEINTPSRCGRLDQVCAYGSTLVLVTFDGNRISTQPVVVREPLHLVIVDLHKGKNTKRILKDLNACYPLPTTSIHAGVHRLLGPINRRIIHAAVDSLRGAHTSSASASSSEAKSDSKPHGKQPLTVVTSREPDVLPMPSPSPRIAAGAPEVVQPVGAILSRMPSPPLERSQSGGAVASSLSSSSSHHVASSDRDGTRVALSALSGSAAASNSADADSKGSEASSSNSDSNSSSHDVALPELDALHSRGATAAQIGHLMTVAQHYFDKHAMPACPSELTAPTLHKVLAYAAIQDLIYGGKGVGSGGDGSAQFVAKSKETREKVIEILQTQLGMSCMRITIEPSGADLHASDAKSSGAS